MDPRFSARPVTTHGTYAFADVPTHADGLARAPSSGSRRDAETASAVSVGKVLAAARAADGRVVNLTVVGSEAADDAARAMQRARDAVFEPDDAPASLAELRASAMDVARAKSRVFEEAREHLDERERHLADVALHHQRRVTEAADRRRATHAEWLRQEADRRNKTAAANEKRGMSWYAQATQVRAFEHAKMDVESGGGLGGTGSGGMNKTLLPVRWLWETWGMRPTGAGIGGGGGDGGGWNLWNGPEADGAKHAAAHLGSLGAPQPGAACNLPDSPGRALSEEAKESIRDAARLERESEMFEAEVRNEIGAEVLRRKLVENREVTVEECEATARLRVRARWERDYVEAREGAAEEGRDPAVEAAKVLYHNVSDFLSRTRREHPGLVAVVVALTLLTLLVWGGSAGAMGHARALEHAAEHAVEVAKMGEEGATAIGVWAAKTGFVGLET